MTATFGKLENQTLTFQPGLNIISAPNEWGKSTWCAFLAIMLYGLDTREKTTKTALAVKERYAPWSGSPMSGRMELDWNGRDITIERWTKGRTMLGEFRAYETESGLPIPELTGSNCGEMLLCVEKSVFLRSAFLRLSDLPVTADESLRRRLNALVTTGDESGAADELAHKIKDLKNKVRYNRSGLLPQAEEQRKELEGKLSEMDTLQNQLQLLASQQENAVKEAVALENHLQHLQYAAAQEDIRRVEQAHLAAEAAAEQLAKLEDACAALPNREQAMAQLKQHAAFLQEQAALVQEWNTLPPEPTPPQIPARYQETTPSQAVAQAESDTAQLQNLSAAKTKPQKLWFAFAAIAVFFLLLALIIGGSMWAVSVVVIVLGVFGLVACQKTCTKRIQQQIDQLLHRYPGLQPEHWVEDAEFYAETQQQYQDALENALSLRRSIRQRMDDTEEALRSLMGGHSSHDFLLGCNEIIAKHDALVDARRDHQQAAAHAAALGAMAKPTEKPVSPDYLCLSAEDTRQKLADLDFMQRQLQLRLGQYQGRMEALGSRQAIQQQLEGVCRRIDKLTQTYNALELALNALAQARDQLQRRFAPRITEQARQLFAALTGGRYDQLQLQQDLSVNTAAEGDATIRSVQWRSEGTIDQLYLSLRLAVARELTPASPLVLDDVLVRFDDTRHAAAMHLLRAEAENRQILLFTCQSREENVSI
jgi:uncharacterized protein YhaN